MPDFFAPEYRSYIALCREHRLPRFYRDGDWVGAFDQGRPPFVYLPALGDYPGIIGPADARYFWLPQLADWLEMLAAPDDGDENIGFIRSEIGWQCGTLDWAGGLNHIGYGPTREEAAARLAIEVCVATLP